VHRAISFLLWNLLTIQSVFKHIEVAPRIGETPICFWINSKEWMLRHPAVTGAIVGARNSKQVDGIIGAMDFRLTVSEIAELQDR
jgi:aryl-alcohol dehydrogenase-like predicted oxidoreductase